MHTTRIRRAALGFAAVAIASAPAGAITPRFEITYSRAAHAGPITGRLVLFIAKTNQVEPRLALNPRGPAIFAVDIDQLKPDQPAIIDDKAIGFPYGLADLP